MFFLNMFTQFLVKVHLADQQVAQELWGGNLKPAGKMTRAQEKVEKVISHQILNWETNEKISALGCPRKLLKDLKG